MCRLRAASAACPQQPAHAWLGFPELWALGLVTHLLLLSPTRGLCWRELGESVSCPDPSQHCAPAPEQEKEESGDLLATACHRACALAALPAHAVCSELRAWPAPGPGPGPGPPTLPVTCWGAAP